MDEEKHEQLAELSPQQLGERLRTAREHAGLSPSQVWWFMGKYYPGLFPDLPEALSRIEKGDYEEGEYISSKLLIYLANLYGTTVADLVMPVEIGVLKGDLDGVLHAYSAGIISEGLAAHLLGLSRVEVRLAIERREAGENALPETSGGGRWG